MQSHRSLRAWVLAFALLLVPSMSYAADLKVAGWIPYWNDDDGIRSAKKHLGAIDTVYPFAYSVKMDGTLKDLADLDTRVWTRFIDQAQGKDVEVIPSVMWSDEVTMESLLADPVRRAAHIQNIVDMVEDGDFDGVNIDYEGKTAETKDSFSAFLKELNAALDGKLLTCAIEPRTPPESLYKVIPNPLKYSNDYTAIAKYCDRVELMTYDQQRADLLLNKSKAGQPYMPIADVDWVRKVVTLALKDIPKEKIYLGVPTYGYHYEITVAPDWYRDYRRIGALNIPGMLEIARDFKVKPSRNRAGEMSFTYLPKDSKVKLSSSLKVPSDTGTGNMVAARALAYANKTGEEVTFRYAAYSDADAIKQKVDLAKEFGLAGVAIFKIDGDEDAKIWKYLK